MQMFSVKLKRMVPFGIRSRAQDSVIACGTKDISCQSLPYLEQANSPLLTKLCMSTWGRNMQVT